MSKKIILKSVNETKKLAEELASKLQKRIFALVGDLGAGKTTFSQAFLRALGVSGRITSPTFLIIKSYNLKSITYNLQYNRVYHIDCYRLNDSNDLINLGLQEILDNKQNIILLEWADKIKDLLPKNEVIWLNFEHGSSEDERIIIF